MARCTVDGRHQTARRLLPDWVPGSMLAHFGHFDGRIPGVLYTIQNTCKCISWQTHTRLRFTGICTYAPHTAYHMSGGSEGLGEFSASQFEHFYGPALTPPPWRITGSTPAHSSHPTHTHSHTPHTHTHAHTSSPRVPNEDLIKCFTPKMGIKLYKHCTFIMRVIVLEIHHRGLYPPPATHTPKHRRSET